MSFQRVRTSISASGSTCRCCLFGGCERIAAEYRSLFSAAGFELLETVPTASPLSLLIAKPR